MVRVKLDVYRSCSWAEKRRVLEVFWRSGVVAPERIRRAALEYGPWAVLCCLVLALEPLPVLVLSIGRSSALLWAAVGVEVLMMLSLGWAMARLNALQRTTPG